MSNSVLPLVRLTGGEWSPSMDNAIDLEGYRTAMRRCRNALPTKQGGAQRRPGSEWVAAGKLNSSGNPAVSSFRKFQFSPGVTFQLEFCDKGIRFCSGGYNAAQLAVNPTSMPNWVNGASYAAGAFVQVSGFPYYLYNGPLNNSTTTPGSDTAHWVLQAVYEVPAPYSGTGATTIGTTTVVPFTAPNYWTADVCNVQVQVINDVVYIFHPNFPVYKLTRYSNVYTGVAGTGWVLQQVQFLYPAMMDENATDQTIAASGTSGSVTLTAAANGNWATSTLYVPGNTVLDGGVIYDCVQTHTSGTFANDLASGYWQAVTNFVAAHVGSYWQLAYNQAQAYIQALATGSAASYTLPTVTMGQSSYTQQLVGTWEVQTYGVWQGLVTIGVSYDNGKTYQNTYHFLLVVRDGKIQSVREYLDTIHANEVLCS